MALIANLAKIQNAGKRVKLRIPHFPRMRQSGELAINTVYILDSSSARAKSVAQLFVRTPYKSLIYTSYFSLRKAQQGGELLVASLSDATPVIHEYRNGELLFPIVLYDAEPKAPAIVDAMRLGAIDFLKWPFSERHLEILLEEIPKGVVRFEQKKRSLEARRAINQLTRRERQVAELMSLGLTNKEIAHDLEISDRTVEIHRASAIRRLNLRSSAMLVRLVCEKEFLMSQDCE